MAARARWICSIRSRRLKRLAGTAPSRELSFAISNGKDSGALFPSPFEFKQAGKCGIEISDALPHLADMRG